MKLLRILIAVASGISLASADCCKAHCANGQRRCERYICDDGTKATPYCGRGPCNIFGCNCNGGNDPGLWSIHQTSWFFKDVEVVEAKCSWPARRWTWTIRQPINRCSSNSIQPELGRWRWRSILLSHLRREGRSRRGLTTSISEWLLPSDHERYRFADVFTRHDKNGDGVITGDEMRLWIPGYQKDRLFSFP